MHLQIYYYSADRKKHNIFFHQKQNAAQPDRPEGGASIGLQAYHQ